MGSNPALRINKRKSRPLRRLFCVSHRLMHDPMIEPQRLATFDPDAALPAGFFDQEIHALARDLLGRNLVRVTDAGLVAGRIVEVEVYCGADDPASHASSGVATERNGPMFGPGGRAYVYLIYGMYHCLNVVAPPDGQPGAILIRACEPLAGLDAMAHRRGLGDRYEGPMPARVRRNLMSGPGKLCQAMDIDLALQGASLDRPALRLTGGAPLPSRQTERVAATPRIGLNPTTVGEACHWPWRYVVADSPYLSRKT